MGRRRYAPISEVDHVGQRGVAQRVGARAADGPGHVRHAVVNDVVHHVGRVGVGRRAARGHAAALVDRHVDDHRSRFHELQIFPLDEVRRPGTRDQHAADHEVGPAEPLADRVAIGVEAIDVGGCHVVEVAESLEARVEQGDVGSEASGDLGGVGPNRAGSEDEHVGGCHAGHTAQKDATAHLRPLEELGALLDTHPASHFAHRDQERKAAAIVAERLVGHGRGPRGHEALGQMPVGREVEVGEERLAAADQGELLRLRLLHLHHEVGFPEHVGRAVNERRTRGGVGLVGEAGAGARTVLDEHGVPRADEFFGGHGKQGHAVFVPLRLPWHTDDHDTTGFVTDWILKVAGMGSE